MAPTSTNPRTRHFRSIHVYAVLLVLATWTTYLYYRSPTMSSSSSLEQASDEASKLNLQKGDHFQGAATPEFTDMIHLQDLPAEYVPEIGKHRKEGRLVIVGDVHGMRDSLQKLLHKLKFDKHHDHLVLAGDMISKGPDSPGVVDLAMKYGATGVRGNHEDRVLGAYAAMTAEHLEMPSVPDPNEKADKAQDELEELSYSHGDYKDRALVRALGKERMEWLKKCPVILRVGDCGSMGKVVVVHAGLAPGVALEKQDATMVMNMRTIGKDGVPSEGREGVNWQEV
ncbi:metallo-dependent phosphatase-3 [Coleophoma cylindrospora]|uniref:Metallo-dependent phosphatase-3 n=1 Tax=Coleophoma cylindrospora TaxID=1849047 RepID=A0A3D8QKG0_9HELO|nr:metallo-dependent phosphatase-3 [Coleophoma cylindrospora]